MYEQGAFKGDLTYLQKLALSYVIIQEDSRRNELSIASTRGIQAFINPTAYKEVYKDEIDPSEEEHISIDSGISVDINSEEDLDDYLEHMFKERNRFQTFSGTDSVKLEV